MFGFERLGVTLFILILNQPGFTVSAVIQADYLAAHLNSASHGGGFFGARFPHHSRSFSRITKRVDEGLDYLGRILWLAFWQQGVPDRASQGKPFDPLRSPISRYLLTTHSPYLLGVALEK